MADKIRLVLDAKAELGEGPVWCGEENALYWVDILGASFHRFDPATGDDTALALSESVSSFAVRQNGDGAVAATENGVAWLDVKTGALTPICEAESDRPETRFNDGKCDRAGRFWAGTMHRDSSNEPVGGLYRFDIESNTLVSMRRGIGVFNGPAWSPDGATFYHADSPAGLIHAFDCAPETGDISNPRIFAASGTAPGYPDGATVDAEGFLWSARWDGWCVARFAPDGRLDRVVELPVKRPTSCMFGGPDLATLYITSAGLGLDAARRAKYPAAGGILAFEPGVRGLPEPRFKG